MTAKKQRKVCKKRENWERSTSTWNCLWRMEKTSYMRKMPIGLHIATCSQEAKEYTSTAKLVVLRIAWTGDNASANGRTPKQPAPDAWFKIEENQINDLQKRTSPPEHIQFFFLWSITRASSTLIIIPATTLVHPTIVILNLCCLDKINQCMRIRQWRFRILCNWVVVQFRFPK